MDQIPQPHRRCPGKHIEPVVSTALRPRADSSAKASQDMLRSVGVHCLSAVPVHNERSADTCAVSKNPYTESVTKRAMPNALSNHSDADTQSLNPRERPSLSPSI
jgi:hypothetical protein